MKKLILLLTLITTLGLSTKASHSLGGEITYEWVSTSMYNVKLTLYTDCQVGAPAGANLSYSSASNCTPGGMIGLTLSSWKNISQVCDTMQLSCYGGTLPGVIKTEYTGVITALPPCSDWVLSYDICCRNTAPLNISSPGTTSMYIETNLDNSVILNDKSPTYADLPRWFIPVNQTSYINAGAYDADGDSLYFSLITPMGSNAAPVSFMPGYSVNQPFGGNLTSINSQTGIITATPNVVGMSLIAVKVDEYRNGQFLSSVEREFNISAINGMNTLPEITNSTLNFNVCAPSDTLHTDLYSADATDSITTSILPGAVNTIFFPNTTAPFDENTNFLNDTNNLYWSFFTTPTGVDHIAYVNVQDDQCSIFGIQSYAIIVSTVSCGGPCSVDIPTDTISACQNLAQLSANPSGGQPPYSYSWSPTTGLSNPNIANPTVSHAHNQTYYVTMTDGLGCTSSDSVIVNAYNPLFDTLDICSPDSVLLDFGPGGTNYFWQFFTDTLGNTTALSGTNQTMMATQPGEYFGYAVFPGCGALTSSIIVRDTCSPPPCITFDIVTTPPSCPTCNDGTASIINLTGGCPPYAFLWDDPSAQTTQTASGLTFGNYSVTVIDGGCCPGVIQTCCFACDSVWPGDANSDLIANVYDLLPIGVFYNTTGTVRPGATTNWNAEWSTNWGTLQGSGTDIKHVDCDGDGLIDINDVDPILLNYNLTHVARWGENNSPEGINDPLIYIDIAPDTIPNYTPLAVPLMFGTSTLPADSIYGVALSITYDASLIDSIAGVTVDYSNSWLGDEGVDMITLDTNHYSNGQIDIGLVRTDGQMMMNSFGELLTLNVITIDNLSGKTSIYQTLTFDLMNVVIIDNVEEYRLFNQQLDSVIIEKVITSVNDVETENKVHIFPNPNKGSFNIHMSDYNNSRIEIFNTIGQAVDYTSSKQQNGYLKVNLNSFEKGIYFVKVINNDKVTSVEKVIIY